MRHEHALKVFETIDRSLSEIAEIIHGISDSGIAAREESLHQRLKQLASSLPQVKSAWIFDANNMLYGTLFMMGGAYAQQPVQRAVPQRAASLAR